MNKHARASGAGRPPRTQTGTTGAMVIAALLLLLGGFGTALAEGAAGCSAAALSGITLRSDRFPSGTITLHNGRFRAPAAPGSASELVVQLSDRCAFGALGGREIAAAVVVTDGGGSGSFVDLALLVRGPGGWANVDSTLLGDRVKVHSVEIRDTAILIAMTTHGPGDPQCCPTRETTRRFTIQTDRLVAQEEETATPVGDREVIGPVWRWVRTRDSEGIRQRPAEAASGYTLQLRPDGTVLVSGDCNVSGGSFTLRNASLDIMITHSTMAACPDGSVEDAFIRDLGRTGRFVMTDGRFVLEMKLGAGTMEFQR